MANLVQFLTQQRDAARSQKTTAVQDVAGAKTASETKKADVVAATAALNAKLQEIAAIKRQLAEIPTTDDGTALLAALKAAMLAANAAQADIVAKTAAADEASAVLAERGSDLENVIARLTTLESILVDAGALEQTRNPLKQAATQNVRQSATAAINNPPFTTAKTRIEADIPEKLRQRARASAEVELNRVSIAKAVRNRAKAGVNDKLDATEKAKRSMEAADAELEKYVKHAQVLLDDALAKLATVADPAHTPLSAVERTALNENLPARGAAADKEILLKQKQLALDNAQEVLDSTPTPTQQQIDARDAALAARDTAQQDVTPQVKNTLHEWEVALPETHWKLFADYEKARRALEWLRDTDPATLATAVNNAEDALVAAVQTAGTASTALGTARSAFVLRDLVFTAAERNIATRVFSALRGDA